MSKNKELINLDSEKSVMNFLQQPTVKIAEVLTGILSSSIKDHKLSAGQLVQALIKGKLFTQLGRELQKYKKKGEIKEDYFESDKNRMSFYELLKFIDEDVPDEERFKAMKSIFLKSISKDAKEEDEEMAYEFIQICKKLSSGEIVVLKSVYDIVQENKHKTYANVGHGANAWLYVIAQQIGHGISSLVELHEKKLIELKLISNRNFSDKSGFEETKYFRLTELGYKLCEFISKYK